MQSAHFAYQFTTYEPGPRLGPLHTANRPPPVLQHTTSGILSQQCAQYRHKSNQLWPHFQLMLMGTDKAWTSNTVVLMYCISDSLECKWRGLAESHTLLRVCIFLHCSVLPSVSLAEFDCSSTIVNLSISVHSFCCTGLWGYRKKPSSWLASWSNWSEIWSQSLTGLGIISTVATCPLKITDFTVCTLVEAWLCFLFFITIHWVTNRNSQCVINDMSPQSHQDEVRPENCSN